MNMFEGWAIPLDQLVQYMYVIIIIETVILALIRFLAWDICYVWIKAWWTKRPINIEWTKSKQWKFQIPVIPKGVPEVWELDGGTRVIEVRREAVGIAPHKVPMMMTTSEFPAAVCPTEINGERFYVPQDSFWGVLFNGKIHKVVEPSSQELAEYQRLGLNKARTADEETLYNELVSLVEGWNRRKLWVKYPEHGLNVSEFVSYQRVSTDPKIVSAYARRKELDSKIASFGGLSNTILQNPIPVFIILFGVALAIWWINDQSQAAAVSQQLNLCKDEMIAYATGKSVPNLQGGLTVLNETLARGGGVQ